MKSSPIIIKLSAQCCTLAVPSPKNNFYHSLLILSCGHTDTHTVVNKKEKGVHSIKVNVFKLNVLFLFCTDFLNTLVILYWLVAADADRSFPDWDWHYDQAMICTEREYINICIWNILAFICLSVVTAKSWEQSSKIKTHCAKLEQHSPGSPHTQISLLVMFKHFCPRVLDIFVFVSPRIRRACQLQAVTVCLHLH